MSLSDNQESKIDITLDDSDKVQVECNFVSSLKERKTIAIIVIVIAGVIGLTAMSLYSTAPYMTYIKPLCILVLFAALCVFSRILGKKNQEKQENEAKKIEEAYLNLNEKKEHHY